MIVILSFSNQNLYKLYNSIELNILILILLFYHFNIFIYLSIYFFTSIFYLFIYFIVLFLSILIGWKGIFGQIQM